MNSSWLVDDMAPDKTRDVVLLGVLLVGLCIARGVRKGWVGSHSE